MDAKLILIVVGVGLACFVLGLLVRGRRGDDRMIVRRSPFTAPDSQPGETRGSYGGANVGIDLQLGRDLEGLLSAGKKIEAIKLVRERTGRGLKEAKEAVDQLESLMKRLNG